MAKLKAQWDVIQLDYPELTAKVYDLILKTASKQGCGDTDDPVVDALWAKHRYLFDDLNEAASASTEKEKRLATEGALTASGRRAIKEHLEKALARHAEVAEMTVPDLAALKNAALRERHRETDAERAARGRENDLLRPFNEPGSEADITAWMKKKIWTPEQAVALSLGKDPSVANAKKLMPYWKVHVSAFAEEFGRRLELVTHECDLGELKPHIKPMDFVNWARANGIGEQFEKYPQKIFAEIDPRKLHKLYSLILASARIKYKIDLIAFAKSPGSKEHLEKLAEFEADTDAIGCRVGADTIERHLLSAIAWARGKGLFTEKLAVPTNLNRSPHKKSQRNFP